MRKIDAMIVGAQKAGTTSLKNYLSGHPEVLSHPQTEFAYFGSEKEYKEDYNVVFDRYFTIGNQNAKITLAKNVGIYSSPIAIERLYNANPDCKILFIIRNPVSRAISSFNMEKFNGWLEKDIEDLVPIAKKKEKGVFRIFYELGMYVNHLKDLQARFPKKNIRIYLFEEFKENPERIYFDLCDFLNLHKGYLPNFDKKHNQTHLPRSKFYAKILISLRRENNPIKQFVKKAITYSLFTTLGQKALSLNQSEKNKDDLPEQVIEFLYDYFKPYNRELEDATGLDLSIWKKKEN